MNFDFYKLLVITVVWDIIFISFITIFNNADFRKWDQNITKPNFWQ